MKKIQYREMRDEDDVAGYLKVHDTLWPSVSMKFWREWTRMEEVTISLAFMNGEVVGGIPFHIRNFRVRPNVTIKAAFEFSVIVREDLRDQGIGSNMMNAAKIFLKGKREEFREADKEKEYDKALEDAADHDKIEIAKEQVMLVDYPKPVKKYYLVYETPFLSIEPVYYYAMRLLFDLGFPIVDKITDLFTAAEHSSFYGAAAQTLGLAQDKVSTFLATIGKLLI